MRDFIKKTLENGLQVYFYKDKNMKRTVVSYNVRYGTNGYYDKFYYKDKFYTMKPGMAHFLEHTLIETCKYGNMVHKFRGKNYEFNGLTYGNLTSYYFVGIKGIEESLKELIEMVDDVHFSKNGVEGVKSAIIDEVRKSDDQKYAVAHNINRRNLYSDFETCPPNGNQLGSGETTRAITLDEVKVAYSAYYNVANKFLVIAGNIDIDNYIKLLEDITSKLPVLKNELRLCQYPNRHEIRTPYQEITKPVDNPYLIMTFKIDEKSVSLLDLDIALFIFFRIRFSNDSRFVLKLMEDKVVLGGIGWNTSYFLGDTLVTFGADILDKDEFIERITEELKDLRIDPRKFELIKRNLIANELSKLDYIYRSIKKFPVDICYSEKLFALDELKGFTCERVEEIISRIKFDNRSILLIKKEVN